MTASTVKGPNYLLIGPRQGVYCRPTMVLATWPSEHQRGRAVPHGHFQHSDTAAGGRVRWRVSQFRSPDLSYRQRARADPDPLLLGDDIPQIPGKIIEAPPIAIDWETKPGHKLHVSHSSGNLPRNSVPHSGSLPHNSVPHSGSVPHSSSASGLSRWHTHQQQQQPARSSSRTRLEDCHKTFSGPPVFSIQASAVTIQSRTTARPVSASKRVAPPDEPFPYPDPLLVGGDHAFTVRLAEFAGLQRDTVKYEEFRARIARRNIAVTTCSTSSSSSSSSQANHHQQPVRPSSSYSRPSTPTRGGVSRRISLPAANTMQERLSQSTSSGCGSVSNRQSSSPCGASQKTDNSSSSAQLQSSTKLQQNTPDVAAKSTSEISSPLLSPTIELTESNAVHRLEEGVKNAVTDTDGVEETNGEEDSMEAQSSRVTLTAPTSRHRNLVEAIFSPKKQQELEHSEPPGPVDVSIDPSAESTLGTINASEVKEIHCRATVRQDTVISENTVRGEDDCPCSVQLGSDNSQTRESESPIAKAPESHAKCSTNSKTSPSQRPVAPATPVTRQQATPPNGSSAHSSTSSSSLTSESTHSQSHTHNRSGGKSGHSHAHSKSTKTRKHTSKTGKCKKDSHHS